MTYIGYRVNRVMAHMTAGQKGLVLITHNLGIQHPPDRRLVSSDRAQLEATNSWAFGAY